jgi:hypothetical protein
VYHILCHFSIYDNHVDWQPHQQNPELSSNSCQFTLIFHKKRGTSPSRRNHKNPLAGKFPKKNLLNGGIDRKINKSMRSFEFQSPAAAHCFPHPHSQKRPELMPTYWGVKQASPSPPKKTTTTTATATTTTTVDLSTYEGHKVSDQAVSQSQPRRSGKYPLVFYPKMIEEKFWALP